MPLFTFLAETLSDPNDKQGSTQRLCLLLFLGTIMALITLVTVANNPMTLPNIPSSILELIYYVIGVLIGGIAFAKAAAVYKAVNAPPVPGGSNEQAPAISAVPTVQSEQPGDQQQ